ncbi:MAG: TraR/DksA family transcriptional regulator [bacterium]|nr:TraR/DksA family transcriptional regulator [bacterium]
MTSHHLRELTEALETARRVRMAEKAGTEDDLRVIASEKEAEMEERAQEERTASILVSLSAHDQRAIADIDRALARVEDGTYGECEGCENPIPIARLRAIPTARRCIECQEAEERRQASHATRAPSPGTGYAAEADAFDEM